MTVKVGDLAPPFKGKIVDGKETRAFDLGEVLGKGPVVLAFFPFAFSSTCEGQLCDLRDNLPALGQVEAQVFGISTDSPWTLQAFHRAHGFRFPLISDWNREAIDGYGLFYEEFRGLKRPAKRATVVIDRQGRIAWIWSTEDANVAPDIAAIKSAVAKLG